MRAENKQSDLSPYQKALLELSQLVNEHELIQMIEELDRLEVACRRSAQPVMNLEIGLLSLCHRLDIIELQSLQSRLEKLESERLRRPKRAALRLPLTEVDQEGIEFINEQKSAARPDKTDRADVISVDNQQFRSSITDRS